MLALLSIFLLIAFAGLFGIGFALTGAVLTVLFWMFIKVPIGFALFVFGTALCCTVFLIPVGLPMISFGARLMVPGGAV